jgi:hypothetical protein
VNILTSKEADKEVKKEVKGETGYAEKKKICISGRCAPHRRV